MILIHQTPVNAERSEARRCTKEELTEAHPSYADIVGCDVCVLPLAFPGDTLQAVGSVGWRGQVVGKRGQQSVLQVKVFGQWFHLNDSSKMCPIEQPVEEEGEDGGEEEGEEEEEEGEETEEEEGGEGEEEDAEMEEGVEEDSSGDEVVYRRKKQCCSV